MQLPVGVRLLALGIKPPFSVDVFLESIAPESLILLSLFNPRPSSSPFRLPLFGFASVLLLMALFELMYGGEKVLGVERSRGLGDVYKRQNPNHKSHIIACH